MANGGLRFTLRGILSSGISHHLARSTSAHIAYFLMSSVLPGPSIEGQFEDLFKRSDEGDYGGGSIYTIIYIVLIIALANNAALVSIGSANTLTVHTIAWLFIVAVVLYLALRRYRRNRWLAAQGIDPHSRHLRSHGIVLTKQKRLLTEEEVRTLPIATLTQDDIQAAKGVATQTTMPQPSATRDRQSHVADSPVQAYALPEVSFDGYAGDGQASLSTPITVPEPVASSQRMAISNESTPLHSANDPQQHLTLAATALSEAAAPATAATAATAAAHSSVWLDGPPLHEENCAICLEDFAQDEQVRRLPCRHYFHVPCIDPWLSRRSATCPLCNYNVATGFDDASEK
ncbi:hypothetical protein GQ54DRAFT_332488 [Martensiomyces pterosporus]|nr:hypothetical protein GQ54DRAFT_332488 [Martensiomyces pterosporus]